MSVASQDMTYAYRRHAPGARGGFAVLALHKTGEDETTALGQAARVFGDCAIVAPRGDVPEGDSLRFFGRTSDRSFDVDDWARAGRKLTQFAAETCQPDAGGAVLFGVSHGANAGLAALVADPGPFAAAVLLRPAPIPDGQGVRSLGKIPVLVLSGTADEVVPLSRSTKLVEDLRGAGATVTQIKVVGGHRINEADLALAHEWWASHRPAAQDHNQGTAP